MKNIAGKLLLGSSMRFISLLLTIGISFVMMPYLIHTLTDYWYGLWVVIGSLLGFYGVLDMGISSATQRYIAEAMPRNDPKELNAIASTAFGIFTVVGGIAVLITIIVALAGSFFIESREDLVIFRWTVIISGLGVALNFLFWVLFGIITSNLRYYVMSYVEISKIILRAVLFYIFLEQGYSIIAMAAVTVSLDLLAFTILYRYAKKIAPWLNLSFKFIDRDLVGKLFNFGKYAFLVHICYIVRDKSDNLLIPVYFAVSLVTHYAIAFQISYYFRSAIVSLVGVMVPVYTKYYSEKNYEKLKESYFTVTRLATILCMLGIGAIYLVSGPFISLWLGEEYLDAHLPLMVLSASVFLYGIQFPTVNLMFAIGNHKYYSYMCIFEVICNIFLTLMLLPKYGLLGAAVGTLAPMVVTRIFVQPSLVLKVVGITRFQYYFEVLKIIFFMFSLQVIVVKVFDYVSFELDSYINLVLYLLAIYSVVLLFVFVFLVTKKEKAIVVNIIRKTVFKKSSA